MKPIPTWVERTQADKWKQETTTYMQAEIDELRTRLAEVAHRQKPVAYITETEQGPMVWTPEMYGEACTYCDDGEFPLPLVKL